MIVKRSQSMQEVVVHFTHRELEVIEHYLQYLPNNDPAVCALKREFIHHEVRAASK
jgi:hypothetical protein